MSELGIYEGCYVQLRNGDVVGPVRRSEEDLGWPWYINEGAPCWSDEGYIMYAHSVEPQDIVRVMPKDAIKLTMSKTYGDFSKLGQSTIPPHVTQAAMDAGIKADPAYEQFVNAILTAGFKAQYEIEFAPTVEQAPIDMDALCEQLARALPSPKTLSECSDEMKEKLRKLADAAVSYLGDKAFPENESENRIPDSEKPKGGLSDLRSEVVRILCDNDSVRGVGATADEIMKIVESGQNGVPVIPSLREIHDEVLGVVRDWHAKYGRDSKPSTFSIAKAFHQMLTPHKDGEPETFFDMLKTMEYKSTKE